MPAIYESSVLRRKEDSCGLVAPWSGLELPCFKVLCSDFEERDETVSMGILYIGAVRYAELLMDAMDGNIGKKHSLHTPW